VLKISQIAVRQRNTSKVQV